MGIEMSEITKSNPKHYEPCEVCGRRSMFKPLYAANLCSLCVDEMETNARRQAVKALRKQWRERSTVDESVSSG